MNKNCGYDSSNRTKRGYDKLWVLGDKMTEHEFTKLDVLYRTWVYELYGKVIRMFKWTGLPCPQRELEMRLMRNGFALLVKDDKAGWIITDCSLVGVTPYDDIFTHAVYAGPKVTGGTVELEKKSVLIRNNSLSIGVMQMIYKYASLLAHTEITYKLAAVNLRTFDTFAASDSQTVDNINAWYNMLYQGEPKAIITTMQAQLLESDPIRNVANAGGRKLDLMGVLDARDNILRQFYRDIGIRQIKEKRANMTTEEIKDSDDMLYFNISDMLQCRKDGCEDAALAGYGGLSVELSEEFEHLMQDDNQEEDGNETDDSE